MEDAGITQDQEDAFESDSLVSQDDDDFDIEETVNDYSSSSSMEDLEKQLQGALEQEDYELASKLRDEIKKEIHRIGIVLFCCVAIAGLHNCFGNNTFEDEVYYRSGKVLKLFKVRYFYK